MNTFTGKKILEVLTCKNINGISTEGLKWFTRGVMPSDHESNNQKKWLTVVTDILNSASKLQSESDDDYSFGDIPINDKLVDIIVESGDTIRIDYGTDKSYTLRLISTKAEPINTERGKNAQKALYAILREIIQHNPTELNIAVGSNNQNSDYGDIIGGKPILQYPIYSANFLMSLMGISTFTNTNKAIATQVYGAFLNRIEGVDKSDSTASSYAADLLDLLAPSDCIKQNIKLNKHNSPFYKAPNIDKGKINPNAKDMNKKMDFSMFNKKFAQTTNGKFNDPDLFKIGDVILSIPPTNITVTQLRAATQIPLIGYESKSTGSYAARIAFKINLVFAANQIDGDLKRILMQFRYCPINIIHSNTLYDLCVAENSWLGVKDAELTHRLVPVTMDEYVLYTIPNHPDSLGLTLQLSLFNFAGYLPSVDNEDIDGFKYFEFDISVDPEKMMDKLVTMAEATYVHPAQNDSHFKSTEHLERAAHLYNLDIERILEDKNRRFFVEKDYVPEYESANGQPLSSGRSTNGSFVLMQKMTSIFNHLSIDIERMAQDKLEKGVLLFTAESISIRFQNHFAWQPVLGYSQPIAQYIGPGETIISINTKMPYKEKTGKHNLDFGNINWFLKTYMETVEQDVLAHYDDRYLIQSSMTQFADCTFASLRDVSVASIPNHPDYADINLSFIKAPYYRAQNEFNRCVEFDEYWGFKRLLKMLKNDKFKQAVEKTLESEFPDESLLTVPDTEDPLKGKQDKTSPFISKFRAYVKEQIKLDNDKTRIWENGTVIKVNELYKIQKAISNFQDKVDTEISTDYTDQPSVRRPFTEQERLLPSSYILAEYIKKVHSDITDVNDNTLFDTASQNKDDMLRGLVVEFLGLFPTHLWPQIFKYPPSPAVNTGSSTGLSYTSEAFPLMSTALTDHDSAKKLVFKCKDAVKEMFSEDNLTTTMTNLIWPNSNNDRLEQLKIESDALLSEFVHYGAEEQSDKQSVLIEFLNTELQTHVKSFNTSNIIVLDRKMSEEHNSVECDIKANTQDIQGKVRTFYTVRFYQKSKNEKASLDTPKDINNQIAYGDRSTVILKDKNLIIEEYYNLTTIDCMPFAAHRWFPMVDRFMANDRLTANCVGSWWTNSPITAIKRLSKAMIDGASLAVSPLIDVDSMVKLIKPEADRTEESKTALSNVQAGQNPSQLLNFLSMPSAKNWLGSKTSKELEDRYLQRFNPSKLDVAMVTDFTHSPKYITGEQRKDAANNKAFAGFSDYIMGNLSIGIATDEHLKAFLDNESYESEFQLSKTSNSADDYNIITQADNMLDKGSSEVGIRPVNSSKINYRSELSTNDISGKGRIGEKITKRNVLTPVGTSHINAMAKFQKGTFDISKNTHAKKKESATSSDTSTSDTTPETSPNANNPPILTEDQKLNEISSILQIALKEHFTLYGTTLEGSSASDSSMTNRDLIIRWIVGYIKAKKQVNLIYDYFYNSGFLGIYSENGISVTRKNNGNLRPLEVALQIAMTFALPDVKKDKQDNNSRILEAINATYKTVGNDRTRKQLVNSILSKATYLNTSIFYSNKYNVTGVGSSNPQKKAMIQKIDKKIIFERIYIEYQRTQQQYLPEQNSLNSILHNIVINENDPVSILLYYTAIAGALKLIPGLYGSLAGENLTPMLPDYLIDFIKKSGKSFPELEKDIGVDVGDKKEDLNIKVFDNSLFSLLGQAFDAPAVATSKDTPVSEGAKYVNDRTTTSSKLIEANKTFAIKQYLDSMLPTYGLQHAYPTYKLYVIDPDTSDIRLSSLDDYYDFRLVQDLMVVKSKESPAHILKARVVIDPRYMTVAKDMLPRDMAASQGWVSRMDPPESKEIMPIAEDIDTFASKRFSMGRVPIRAGMRVCVKLGYHTDPRMLTTVFIGTIGQLSPSMESDVYELEALGDGRELSMPASISSGSFSGKNWGDIIYKMMKASPHVSHFGKSYGTVIERFSREHHLLYGIMKTMSGIFSSEGAITVALRAQVLLQAGIPYGAYQSYKKFGLSATLIGTAVVGAVVGVMLGVWLYISDDADIKKGRKLFVHRFSQRYREMVNKGPDRDRKTEERIADTSNIFEIRNIVNGATFDLEKASRQIAMKFYNMHAYDHDPIDDNIWAVDIWANLINFGKSFSLPAHNRRSIWEILCDIKRLYPNYALDVRPYGSRSTLYLGPTEWAMFRTDDPMLAMAPQFYQMSGINDDVKVKTAEIFKEIYNADGYFRSNHGGSGSTLEAPMVSFQKHHIVTSDTNIIMNGVRSTPFRGYNGVALNYGSGGNEVEDVIANAEILPQSINRRTFEAKWISTAVGARQYSLGLLKEGVEKMYGGTLVIAGNPKIEPYDKVFIDDKVNQMFGWIEVETVIHKFDHNFGYTTHIVPNLVCAINGDAYKTANAIARSVLFSSNGKGWFCGIGTAAIVGAAFFFLPIALPLWTTLAFTVGSLGLIGLDVLNQSKSMINKFAGGDISRSTDHDILMMLGESVRLSNTIDFYKYTFMAHQILKSFSSIIADLAGEIGTPNSAGEFSLSTKLRLNILNKFYNLSDLGLWKGQLWNNNYTKLQGQANAARNGGSALRQDALRAWKYIQSKVLDKVSKASWLPFTSAGQFTAAANAIAELITITNPVTNRTYTGEPISNATINNMVEDIKKGIGSTTRISAHISLQIIGVQEAIKNAEQSLANAIDTKKAELQKNIAIMKEHLRSLEEYRQRLSTYSEKLTTRNSTETRASTRGNDVAKSKNTPWRATRLYGAVRSMTSIFSPTVMTLHALSAVPLALETFLVNSLTKNNSITIYPLWYKHSLMNAGMEGYNTNNAFMHIRGMALYAKNIVDQISGPGLAFAMPTYPDAASNPSTPAPQTSAPASTLPLPKAYSDIRAAGGSTPDSLLCKNMQYVSGLVGSDSKLIKEAIDLYCDSGNNDNAKKYITNALITTLMSFETGAIWPKNSGSMDVNITLLEEKMNKTWASATSKIGNGNNYQTIGPMQVGLHVRNNSLAGIPEQALKTFIVSKLSISDAAIRNNYISTIKAISTDDYAYSEDGKGVSDTTTGKPLVGFYKGSRINSDIINIHDILALVNAIAETKNNIGLAVAVLCSKLNNRKVKAAINSAEASDKILYVGKELINAYVGNMNDDVKRRQAILKRYMNACRNASAEIKSATEAKDLLAKVPVRGQRAKSNNYNYEDRQLDSLDSRIHVIAAEVIKIMNGVFNTSGLQIVSTSCFRSVDKQRDLNNTNNKQGYALAAPGRSPHQIRIAFDFGLQSTDGTSAYHEAASKIDLIEKAVKAVRNADYPIIWGGKPGEYGWGSNTKFDPVHIGFDNYFFINRPADKDKPISITRCRLENDKVTLNLSDDVAVEGDGAPDVQE